MDKIAQKIKSFFNEVIIEGKKVNWPRREEALNHTLIVIGISVGVAIFLGIMDFLFLKILTRFMF